MADELSKRDKNYIATSLGVDVNTGEIRLFKFDGDYLLISSGPDGVTRIESVPYAQKRTEVGNILYFAEAEPGSSTASQVWRVRKIDDDTGLTTWADGNADFDNLATDLTALTYS